MKARKIIAGGIAGSLLLLGVAVVIHPGAVSRKAAGDASSEKATVRTAPPPASPAAASSGEGRSRRADGEEMGGAVPGSSSVSVSEGGSLPEPGEGGARGGLASGATLPSSGASPAPVPGGLASTASSSHSGELAVPPGESNSDAARIAEMLAVAQRAPSTEERLDAVRWLGRNGSPAQFDALLAIQIHDPDAAVRRAAEASSNELRSRHAHQPWPGVQTPADPFGYMDEEPHP